MAYSNQSDLLKIVDENTLAQLTDDVAGDTIDVDVISEAISDADELIDLYLRARYSVPFPSPPDALKQVSRNIALYNLYARRPETEMPATVEDRNDAAGSLLTAIRDGKINLGTTTQNASGVTKYKTNKTDKDRRFTGRERL